MPKFCFVKIAAKINYYRSWVNTSPGSAGTHMARVKNIGYLLHKILNKYIK